MHSSPGGVDVGGPEPWNGGAVVDDDADLLIKDDGSINDDDDDDDVVLCRLLGRLGLFLCLHPGHWFVDGLNRGHCRKLWLYYWAEGCCHGDIFCGPRD